MGEEVPSVYLSRNVMETMKVYALSVLLAFGILFIVTLFVNYFLLYYVGGTLFLMSLLGPAVTKWRPQKRISPNGKAVFITGCDSGFGYLLAQRLDDLGFHVFAGCLLPDGAGASNLRKSESDRMHVIGLDVTSDKNVEEALDYVKENLKDNVLWAIVNKAGIHQTGELPWISVERIQKLVDVNTLGVVRVTKAFLSMLKESKGRIITVASLGGRHVLPGIVPYCLSKKAVISFCDGLRLELYKWDVQVITIEPSTYRTPMTSTEELRKNAFQSWETAPKEVKDMYDSNYMEMSLSKFISLATFFGRHPSEVVSVMEDAITALFPAYSYVPGSLVSQIQLWILQMLPQPVVDILILYVFYGKSLW